MADSITKEKARRAFELLGRAIGGYHTIEIVLVGSMAGRFGGWLPDAVITRDCDVIDFDPEHAIGYVETETFNVARQIGLPTRWLNGAAQGFAWTLPRGWQDRKRLIGTFGLLTIYHVGRLDLIASKVVASRDIDRSHLLQMTVTDEELRFVEDHLTRLEEEGYDSDRIERGRDTILILKDAR